MDDAGGISVPLVEPMLARAVAVALALAVEDGLPLPSSEPPPPHALKRTLPPSAVRQPRNSRRFTMSNYFHNREILSKKSPNISFWKFELFNAPANIHSRLGVLKNEYSSARFECNTRL
jgi:hypothetical protein